MEARFIHTADWHLGKPFAFIRDDSKRHYAQQERFHAIARMGEIARKTSAEFLLIAGDLFDSSRATKVTVSAACLAIGEIGLPVFVIPGNHDHAGPGSIWEQEFFQRELQQLAPNLRILLQREPVILSSAILFPAPLLRRHEPNDPTAWIRQAAADPALPADFPRIVLAHGTIQGFGMSQQDDEDAPATPNWIDLGNFHLDQIDYVALGDWHGTRQVDAKSWYSGTPEIDRFPKNATYDPGNILAVSVARGKSPQVEKISSSRLKWQQLDHFFSEDTCLAAFSQKLSEMIGPRGAEHLISLTIKGSLNLEASQELENSLESWEARLLHLRLDHGVAIAPSEEEISALTRRIDDPLISAVAAQLVEKMHGESETAEIARLALRELHSALV